MSSQEQESYGPVRSARRGQSDRLLRAIEELQALERERRRAAASSRPFQDLQRRLEAKAREVFRITDDVEDEPDAKAGHH